VLQTRPAPTPAPIGTLTGSSRPVKKILGPSSFFLTASRPRSKVTSVSKPEAERRTCKHNIALTPSEEQAALEGIAEAAPEAYGRGVKDFFLFVLHRHMARKKRKVAR